MNTETCTVGRRVWDLLGTGIYGVVEYVHDGWVGVRDDDGRLDELPLNRAVDDATDALMVPSFD